MPSYYKDLVGTASRLCIVAARQIRRDPDRAEDALECLEKTGFARRVPYTMNFSDVSYFRICTGSEEAD